MRDQISKAAAVANVDARQPARHYVGHPTDLIPRAMRASGDPGDHHAHQVHRRVAALVASLRPPLRRVADAAGHPGYRLRRAVWATCWRAFWRHG
jgi:hypothetical protein